MPQLRFLCLFMLLACSVKAQLLHTRKYYFTHYPTNSGLISNEVNAVIQDKDGYIWAGTNDGLQRFDGTRFKTFRHEERNKNSIPSNLIYQLLIDKKNNLWVLTADGHLGIFDTKNFIFKEAKLTIHDKNALAFSLKRLIMDEFGRLFFLMQGKELITYNERAHEFSYAYNLFQTPEGYGITGFIQEPGTDRYWLSFQGKGFYIYDHSTGKLEMLEDDGNDPGIAQLQHVPSPFHFFFDSRKRLWFQSWGGGFPYVYCYDRNAKDPVMEFEFITTLKSYYETEYFYEQKDGTIWICGLGLLARFNEKEKTFELTYNGYQNERSIQYERVNSISEDQEKNIWVATNNNGLYRFNPEMQFFTNTAHIHRITKNPGHGSVLSALPTKWGGLLVSTWGDGIYYYNKELQLIPADINGIDNKGGPTVWAMAASRDSNTIWMGAQPGVWKLDQDKRKATYFNPALFNGRTVRQVIEDVKGDLWFGLHGRGVYKWEAAKGKISFEEGLSRFEGVPEVMINKLLTDHTGLIWVCTGSQGLYVIDPRNNKVVYHFHPDSKGGFHLPETGVSSVLDFDAENMIITLSNQVLIFNRRLQTIKPVSGKETGPGLIASVEKDQQGYLWISTTTGLYRANIHKKIFIRFNREDGIDNDHFILSSSSTLPDGRLFFGSSDQFIIFDPSKIKMSTLVPATTITDISVGNRSLKVDSVLQLPEMELKYNNNSVVIEFSTLLYNTPGIIRYKLDGLDKEWKLAEADNHAVYTYLPPGKYTFMIGTLNEVGDSSGPVTKLVIKVNSPFWKTWWFYSLLVILAGAVIYGLDRERLKRKEAILKMRTDIADNLHDQVHTALNNINILSEMARLKAEKDPSKSKEYIEQIHSKSHNMIIAMDDMLWSIDPGNDDMSKTTERMREYIDALKNRYGVQIELQVDKSVNALELNMRLRHEAFLIFKEGIKNLVTVGARNCHVYISFEKGKLLFTTQFDTETCDLRQLNNLLHRQDLENRLKALQANIDIDVRKTHSLITLEVPVA